MTCTRFSFVMLTLIALAGLGCSSSTTGDGGPPDGSVIDSPIITFDAGPDLGTDAPPPRALQQDFAIGPLSCGLFVVTQFRRRNT